MKIKKFVRHMDDAAYNVFESMNACSKSLIMGGLIGAILVAVCAVVAAIYILCNGYTLESGVIFSYLVDRSAALPAIAVFICVISEFSSRDFK